MSRPSGPALTEACLLVSKDSALSVASRLDELYLEIDGGLDISKRRREQRDEALDALKALCDEVDNYRKTGGYPDLVLERELLKEHGR